MSRPTGRFDTQKERCFKIITALTKPKCWASNEWLAQKLKCSVRQVSRYLLALEREKRIIRQQYRYLKQGTLKTRRHVYIQTKKTWMPSLVKEDPVRKIKLKARKTFVMSQKPLPIKKPEHEFKLDESDPKAFLRAMGFRFEERPIDKLAKENPLLFNQLRHKRLRDCAIASSRGENLDSFSLDVQKALSLIPKD